MKILNYVDVILQKFRIKLYSITKEGLLKGSFTNILLFVSKLPTEVDCGHTCQGMTNVMRNEMIKGVIYLAERILECTI